MARLAKHLFLSFVLFGQSHVYAAQMSFSERVKNFARVSLRKKPNARYPLSRMPLGWYLDDFLMEIEYFNDAELRAAEITFSGELNKLIFVESSLPVYQHHLDYKWICVMDPMGKIYAFKRGGTRRHSSALRGDFVSSAGSKCSDLSAKGACSLSGST